jgi:hypothetical protein
MGLQVLESDRCRNRFLLHDSNRRKAPWNQKSVYETVYCPARGGPPGVTTLTEWTFYQPIQNGDKTYFFDHPDISAVNGANLTVDIEPVGGDPTDPTAPTNDLWLKWNYPLSVPGADLRANDNGNFNLKRSDIDKSGVYGYVIVDEDGNPVMPPGDNVLACFSNCGKYEYPNTPDINCDSTDPNQPDCYAWKTFCAGDPSLYGQECTDDDDCTVKGVNVHASCWKNADPQQKKGTCSLRAFYQKPSNECPDEPAGPASKVRCTFAYGATNPLTTMRDYSTQRPSALCESVIGTDGKEVGCIGDDTVHQVFHGAYTWPNDPETFADDATLYRIIYASGGYSSANGIDLFVGRRTHRLFHEAGLVDVKVNPVIHIYPHGHNRRPVFWRFLQNVRDRVLEQELITESEFDGLTAELKKHLDRPDTLVVSHLFFQVWGRKPV